MDCDVPLSRRSFLEFMGRGCLGLAGAGLTSRALLAHAEPGVPFTSLAPSKADELRLAQGLEAALVARFRDRVTAAGETFGQDCDFTAFLPLSPGDSGDGLLWVNHEWCVPTFLVSGWEPGKERTRDQVLVEQDSVGGTILRVTRDASGKWKAVPDDPMSRRLTARTRIPFAWSHPIAGAREAVGTLANCSGGVTPWGTILSCEENYHNFYGESDATGKRAKGSELGWEKFFDFPPEHYGWVVEIEPRTGAAKKLVAFGRFAHEGATTTVARDGRAVVYLGDDAEDKCLYKFVSERAGSLERGTLYVADLKRNLWVPLDREKVPALGKRFKTQTELLIRAREAAEIAGGTPLGRPEGIAVDRASGAVFAALTNHKKKGDPFGYLLKIEEAAGDPLALELKWSRFLSGGAETGFACPDNVVFDRKGNLWFTTDMSGKDMHEGPLASFQNNSLFVVPMAGPSAGRALRVATAPTDAELTGPSFTPDGRTLFLSVQHPGERSTAKELTSHWPDGAKARPRSSVVAITGKTLDALCGDTEAKRKT